MRSRPTLCLIFLLFLVPARAGAWGGDVHRLINTSAVQCLPGDLAAFGQWAGDLERLSTAADSRKSYDPDEAERHYIDIDDYPEFFTGTLPQDYNILVAAYGLYRVTENGVAPWAVNDCYRNLVAAFRSGDWALSVRLAADIGHYVGDIHNPLHVTVNYDGQLTGQRGIHSRFESEMTDRYLSLLTPAPGTAVRVVDVLDGVFGWIDQIHPGVRVILDADMAARTAAGGSTSSAVYYESLWSEVGQHTHHWIGSAAVAVASLWYSAWIEAGSPPPPDQNPVQSITSPRRTRISGRK